jgi:putative transposase
MGLRATKHAVYDIKYRLVWTPKYRKHIFNQQIAGYLKEVFQHIADEYEFWIDTMEVMEDHVHVFVEALPKYSPSRQIMKIIKKISDKKPLKPFWMVR